MLRSRGDSWSARRFGPGSAVALLVVGFLVTAGIVQERARERELPGRVEELQALVGRRQGAISALSTEVGRLSARLDRLQRREAAGSEVASELLARVEALRGTAAVAPLEGPGVVVELSDSPREPRTREEVSDFQVHDADLRLVVNELWRAGAEAISVNDRRLASTTAIRTAGSVIQVNLRAIRSPYRVTAIGDPGTLVDGMNRSKIADQFRVWGEVYGLGFRVEQHDRVTVPALPDPTIRWAEPADEGG
jgi:uncharacterized protein YlxW (UPF0749 family)